METLMARVGRPQLPLGTLGKVTVTQLADAQFEARAYFRDFDGRRRYLSRRARTRAAAERGLKADAALRQAAGTGETSGADLRVSVLAEQWLATNHGWSTGTARTYRLVVKNQVKPMGELRLSEVTAGPSRGRCARSR